LPGLFSPQRADEDLNGDKHNVGTVKLQAFSPVSGLPG
jgi:hypothetical protein